MNLAVARILLYLLAGALLNAGWVSEDIASFIRMDPDIQMLAGGAIAALTVLWWRVAKRLGWRT